MTAKNRESEERVGPHKAAEAILRAIEGRRGKWSREVGSKGDGVTRAARDTAAILKGLRWSERALAYWAGIPQGQFNAWLKGTRPPLGAEEIARLAWAIAGALDGVLSMTLGDERRTAAPGDECHGQRSTPREPRRRGNLYARPGCGRVDVIHRFLAEGTTGPEDGVWRSCFDTRTRPLRIGWCNWPPLLEKRPDGEPSGFARDLLNSVCGWLGATDVEWIEKPFSTLTDHLQGRSVDILGVPLLRDPRRTSDYRLTTPIPRLWVGIKAVMRDDCATTKDLGPESVRLLVVEAEAAASVAKVAYPDWQADAKAVDRILAADRGRSGHGAALLAALPDLPRAEGQHDVVLTTTVNVKQSNMEKLSIVDDEKLKRYRFQLAFAVHMKEPRLLEALNAGLDVETRFGLIDSLTVYKDTLRDGGLEVESKEDGDEDV